MADTKISNLPAGAMADGDEFAVASVGGVTEKVTRVQIVAGVAAALAADVGNLAAHVATTTAPIHGSSAAAGANTLAHRNAAGDLTATDFNAAAGAAANPSHTFTGDPNTGHYNYAPDELGVATGGVRRAHWNTTGAVILNDAAASGGMTGPGVTIQQGAYDDEAVALQSTDVAHGMTTLADTDTYLTVGKSQSSSGGALLKGFKDADGDPRGALTLQGFLGENTNTIKTVNGRAIVEIFGYVKSGAGIGNTNADGNVFGVRTRRGGADVTLLLVDEDADLHVLNDIVVAGVVDTINVANHVHTAAAGMGPLLTAAGITDRTRKFFVEAVAAYQVVAGTEIPIDFTGEYGFRLLDGLLCLAWGHFMVPEDFVSGLNIKAVLMPGASGNIAHDMEADYGQCGELWNQHNDAVGFAIQAVTINQNNCMPSLALANEAVGDIVRITYARSGQNAGDTVNADVYINGFIVEYTADS